jgi:hypothetical protein
MTVGGKMKGLKAICTVVALATCFVFVVSCAGDSSGDEAAEVASYGPFDVETAVGDIVSSATLEQVVEGLESLDDDNFFLTMSHDNGFVQTAVSDDDRYYVEYNDGENQYAGVETLTRDEVIQLFSMYYRGDSEWKDIVEWGDH